MRRLEPDELQTALCASVRAFYAGRAPMHTGRAEPLDAVLVDARASWQKVAELGVFEVGTPDGGGSLLDVAFVVEELGRAGVNGPVADTYAALTFATGDELDDLVSGRRWACVELGDRVAWLTDDALVVGLDDGRVSRLGIDEVLRRSSTVGGVASATVATSPTATCESAGDAMAVFDICTAAYLVGLSTSMMTIATDHVRVRRQFGRTLGEFQAVSHVLADSDALVASSQKLVRQAALVSSGTLAAASRRAAADAAVNAATVCHQVCGALGYTREFALWPRSGRAMYVATQGRAPAIDSRLIDSLRGSVELVPVASEESNA